MLKKLSLFGFGLLAFTSFAQPGSASDEDLQPNNVITTALPFMSITPDSRAGAMGEASTALSATASSIYWNTSMLIFAEDDAQIGLSYVPWLRALTNDIHLSYLSGYKQLSDRHVVGGALRFFNLGEITYTTENANIIRTDKPSEYEFTGSYGFKLTDKMAIGINGKFAYSNLTGGITTGGSTSKAAIAGASDISFTYRNDDASFGNYTFATTINNLGNKVSYSESAERDFIPMNLKIGNAFTFDIDDYNAFTASFELQKFLVPTQPVYLDDNPSNEIISGRNPNVGVIAGLIQSFYDAPGTVLKNDDGTYQVDAEGNGVVKKNSKFGEELREINIATGFEYWYNQLIALRGGVFYEHESKGDRKYFNAGVGLKYNAFHIDISYLGSLNGRTNPLANTLRFTLRMTLGE